MRGPRVAVGAGVLAPAVRVDAYVEFNIRRIVVGQDRACRVVEQLRLRRRVFGVRPAITIDVQSLEAVGWIPGRSTAVQDGQGL